MAKDYKNIALAAAIGLAAGYALGVLTAPKSGQETRKDVKDAGTKAYKAAEARLKDTYQDLNDVIATATKQAKKLSSRGKAELDDLLAAAHSAQGRVKSLISSVRKGEATNEEFENAVIAAEVAGDELKDFIKNNK